jgi:hypothetical protein
VDAEARFAIQRLLDTCDLVKFAKMLPLPEQWREIVPQARHIVDITKEVELAPPSPTSPASSTVGVGADGTS